MNQATGLGICEQGMKSCGLVEAEAMDYELVDFEFIGRLRRIGGFPQKHQQRVGNVNFIEHKRIFFRKVRVGSVNQRRGPRDSRRDMNLEPVQTHLGHFVPRPKKGQHVRIERCFANLDQGRNVGPPFIAHHQSVNDAMDARKQIHAQARKLHAALEMSFQVCL